MSVKLVSFNGRETPVEPIDRENNYYLLINETGTIVDNLPKEGIEGDRVLVQFDVQVTTFGLHCHNQISNSLWIKTNDLIIDA